jgi:enoyl-CoA hydratase/carnithine racemase/pimeloyl-ACP methyl ester carboxylesterase
MSYDTIKVDISGHVATLTLNRPEKMNALNRELQLELRQALEQIEDDPAVRAVIITGAGRCFSSGFDISGSIAGTRRTMQQVRDTVKRENDPFFRIWRSRLPFVAAVHGYCLGGACDLAMVCDITIAAESAQFGEPEIQFQSAPAFPIMPWVLGMKKTKELLLTGDRIGAAAAERIGLVNRVVPDDMLLRESRRTALKLAKIPLPAMQLNKQALNRAYDLRGFSATIDLGSEFFGMVMMSDSEEHQEFKKIATERGLKAAFKWRDARFEAGEDASDVSLTGWPAETGMGSMIHIEAEQGRSFAAYLAVPQRVRGPGLVVLPEMYNFNSAIREVADSYAAEGFAVLAPDMYWRSEPGLFMEYTSENRPRARELYTSLDRDHAVADVGRCVAALRRRSEVNGKVAVIGFCMGGEIAALAGCRLPIDAIAIYYGTRMEPHVPELANLAPPTIMHFAGTDPYVPMSTVEAIKAKVAGLGHVAIHVYAGAEHAFARPHHAQFHAEATALARERNRELFRSLLL